MGSKEEIGEGEGHEYRPSFSKNICYCDHSGALGDLVVMRNNDHPSLVDIKAVIKKEGKYRLSLSINEREIGLMEGKKEDLQEREASVVLKVLSGKTQQ